MLVKIQVILGMTWSPFRLECIHSRFSLHSKSGPRKVNSPSVLKMVAPESCRVTSRTTLKMTAVHYNWMLLTVCQSAGYNRRIFNLNFVFLYSCIHSTLYHYFITLSSFRSKGSTHSWYRTRPTESPSLSVLISLYGVWEQSHCQHDDVNSY